MNKIIYGIYFAYHMLGLLTITVITVFQQQINILYIYNKCQLCNKINDEELYHKFVACDGTNDETFRT